MNPLRISMLSVLLIGGLFTLLLTVSHSDQQKSQINDSAEARTNATYLSQQMDENVAALTSSLESLSFNAFWQSSQVNEWSFWLETQKPLFAAAGLNKIGVHSAQNDVVYFETPSRPGQYDDLKQALTRLYETKRTVSLMQLFKGKPALMLFTPIKNVENQIIGALVGIKYLDTAALKKLHHLVKVPVAIVKDQSIQTISIETSPSLQDYQLMTVKWPTQVQSSLWKMVLLVENTQSFPIAIIFAALGTLLTLLLLFIINKQLQVNAKATALLNDTIDDQLPLGEQIQRLLTLQNLTSEPVMLETIQSIRARLEQAQHQKKALSIEVRRLQEQGKSFKIKLKALQSERDSAFAAPKLKSEFLSRMGDEITTPMKSVVSMLKLLSEYPFEPEPKQLLNIAKRSTRTLVDNLNNILDFSKLDAGMLKLKSKNFSVRELVDELSSELSHFANDKGLSLQASTDPDVPGEVKADLFRIRQILRNLLGNAIRFTKEGEVSLYADILQQDGKELLRFTIKDSGVGIPGDAQAGLFDSLEQSTKLTNSSFAGRLRLIVSKDLSELMGGEIGVISNPGAGSQFWFTCKL